MRRPTGSKRTALEIRGLRQRYLNGWSQARLSREYGMSIGQVGRIVRGTAWQTTESGWFPPSQTGPTFTDKGEEV
jgi:hypothetical protein